MDSFIDTLAIHLKAGTPVLVVNTDETVRLIVEVKRAAWKTGDGLAITFEKKEEMKAYRELFSRYIPDHSSFFGKDKKGQPAIIYDSASLVNLFHTIDRQAANSKDKSTIEQIEKDMEAIDKLLSTAYKVVEWNLVDGFNDSGQAMNNMEEALTMTLADPDEKHYPKNCIFVMRDCHPWLNTESTPRYREILRNLVENNLLTGNGCSHHIIFVQPEWTPHRDIHSCLHMMDFSLPNEEQLDREITYIMHNIDDPAKRNVTDELRADLCQSMRGFTQVEAVNALAVCVAKHGGFTGDMISTIHGLQRAAFSKGGVLTMTDDNHIESVDDVGGFENFMQFIDECAMAFSPEAIKLGMPKTKGCLLLGIPGTGKSLVARVTARRMKKPLLVYDFAAQFGSLIGQTEATQRQVLKQITAKGPCVVLLDEADKTFSGVVSGYQGDTGVKLGAFGRLLSWMANENEEAFVILTMNRTIGIPPEMLRAGRLDAIFYTTFPIPRERLDILGIHLRKNGADPSRIKSEALEEVVKATDRYVGAELEQMVKKAVRMAAKRNFERIKHFCQTNKSPLPEQIVQARADYYTPNHEELLLARKVVTPVAKLDKENIDSIEAFCKDTATPVSNESTESKVFKASRSIRLGPSNN
jgi:hypothetical protein